MMNRQQWLASALAISFATTVSANDTGVDEDSLFGGSDSTSEEAMFGSDTEAEGDLFGDGLLSESDEDGVDLAQEMLAGTETFVFNGDFTLSATTTRNDYSNAGKTTSDTIEGAGAITLDVRPSVNLRALVKADYSLDEDASAGSIREAFIDYSIADQWYFRGGKQIMHWGVGYFYSPADLISSDSIDAADPEADRDGTDALKLLYPSGNNNYYAYLVPQTGSSNHAVGLKGEWLVNESEFTASAVSRPSGHNSMALTYYVPSSDVNMFAEYVLHNGITGSSLHSSSDWVSESTVGVSYSLTDDDDYSITWRAQYYDDGVDEEQRAGLSMRWASMYQSDYTLMLSSLSNVSDDSRLNKASLSYSYSDDVKATLSYSKAHGIAGSEYARSGSGDSVSLKLTMLSREF